MPMSEECAQTYRKNNFSETFVSTADTMSAGVACRALWFSAL
jgi:hypothetical protein